MTIARLIEGRSNEIVHCTTQTRVRDAVELLAQRRIGALPVLDSGKVTGIFSERDVIHMLQEHGPAMLDGTVGQVMTAPAVCVSPETGVLEALGLMTQRRFRHLPVVRDGELAAFISIGDLVKFRIDHITSEAEAMRTYIQMA